MWALMLALALVASDDDLVAGRPGLTEARGVVQPGVVQLEAGWACTVGPTDATAPSQAIPGGVLRVGIGRSAELRLANQGVDSLQIGGKVLVTSEPGSHIELGLVPTITVPTRPRSPGRAPYDPGLAVSIGRALPAGFDALGQIKVARTSGDGGRATQYSSGAMITHGVGPAWTAFGEAFVVSSAGASSAAWTGNTGVARRVGRHSQVDLEIARALNGIAPTWSLGFGLVVRR
jgi:hypothetical protein